ncbi:hypothetical protein SAMN04488589_1179 [Methanolobus vulcani]|uniref:ApeA N-terminal domain-containing protein n=1 Tax=Methanolobus vulcani TaxID=38026 RepID=A0A7Z7B171_9EURY|nr:HEPN domain-containing protein [Methanolobus vulcani]SDF70520.1 hypothetical protein SAMN04488589_1179 [Methanolobus vulcani]
MESFEITGKWWLPNKPEKKVHGTLNYSPSSGGELKIIGLLHDRPKVISDGSEFQDEDLILGMAEGRFITCYKCRKIKHSFSFIQGIDEGTLVFDVEFIFEGYHFLREDDILFDEISINYSNLEHWLLDFPLSFEEYFDASNNETKLSFKAQKSEIKLYESSELALYLKTNLNYKRSKYSRSLNQITYFKIFSMDTLHFKDWMDGILFDLKKLISFSLDVPIYPILIKGKRNDHKRIHEFTKKELLLPINIFYKTNQTTEKVYASSLIFSYKDIKEKTSVFFSNWFRISTDLRPMINLYNANIQNKKALETQFLNFTQAVEIYHRRTFSESTYIESELFDELFTALCDIVNDKIKNADARNTFIKKISYINQHSLRRRIKEVLRQLKEDDFIDWDDGECRLFGDKVSEQRDILTHYEKERADKLDYKELAEYTMKTKEIVRICISYELSKY